MRLAAKNEAKGETMKTKTLNREQIGKQNRKTLKIGDRVTINFAGHYWANGITGDAGKPMPRTGTTLDRRART